MPEQVAERWYATDDSELVSHVSKEELGGMLHEVVALSKQPLAHSANGDFPVKFFHTARDDNHDLREILLSAILDDCRSTQQAIRLAVQWGDAKITRLQLQESNQADPSSLRVELETALLAADYNMIKVLTTYYYLTTHTILLLSILLLTTTAHYYSRCSSTLRRTPVRCDSTGWWDAACAVARPQPPISPSVEEWSRPRPPLEASLPMTIKPRGRT